MSPQRTDQKNVVKDQAPVELPNTDKELREASARHSHAMERLRNVVREHYPES